MELSSFIQTPYSISPLLSSWYWLLDAFTEGAGTVLELFNSPKVLLRAHAVPQTRPLLNAYRKGRQRDRDPAPECSGPALIFLPGMCRVLLLPRKKPCGQRCLGPLLEGEGGRQSVTGLVTHVQPGKFDSAWNFWLKRHSSCYWDTAN